MDTQRMFGIRRHIEPHMYRVWDKGGWRKRRFEGSEDIVSAHITELDAQGALAELQRELARKLSGGYMMVHEGEYLRHAHTRLSIIPVDVAMVSSVDQELISQC